MVSLKANPPVSESLQVERPQDLRTELVGIKLSQISGSPDSFGQVLAFRQRVARSFERWLGPNATQTDLLDATQLLSEMAEIGAADVPAPDEHLNAIGVDQPAAAVRLLRTLALVPGWQSGAASLGDAPIWALPLCAAAHFFGPRLLTVEGQGEAFARSYLRAVEDLARLGSMNRGSIAVRAAYDCYLRAPQLSPAWAGALWSELAVARFRLFSAMNPSVASADLLPMPREGRRLRVGLIARQLVDHGVGASLMPLVEQLDSSRFELFLFCPDSGGAAVTQLRNRGAVFVLLDDAPSAVVSLQEATLDVAIFVAEPGQLDDFLFEILRHRVAPLQVWYDGLQEWPGVPQIDLFLGGILGAAPETQNGGARVALLPGVGSTSKNELTSSEGEELTREAAGVPEDTVVMVSFEPFSSLRVADLRTWVSLLARFPAAKLVLCGGEAGDADWLQRFSAHLNRIAVAQGANPDQVVISAGSISSYEARKRVLAIADLVLEADDCSAPESAFAAAECRVPIVVRVGRTRRGQRTASLLRSAGLDELVAASADQFEAIAHRLVNDATWHAAQVDRLGSAAPRWLAQHDSFALSEAFGCILEKAFDELSADQRSFRKRAEPIQAANPDEIDAFLAEARDLIEIGLASEGARRARFALAADGANPETRRILAHALRQEGKHQLAAHLLISQLDLKPLSADSLCEVALASFDAGQMNNALSALRTAISIDERHLDSWLLLARFDDAALRIEIASVLPKIAPDDPRVRQLLDEWNQVGLVTS